VPTFHVTREYVQSRFKGFIHRLSDCKDRISNPSDNPSFVVETAVTTMKAVIEHAWRILYHQGMGQETSRFKRSDEAQFPMGIQKSKPWTFKKSFVNSDLQADMEKMAATMMPRVLGHTTVFDSIRSFWMLVLQDLRDISTHRDAICEEHSVVTPFTADMNPSRTILIVPSHGHFHLPIAKISNVMALDTYSRTRHGENMMIRVDAYEACLAMLDAVSSVLKSLEDMSLSHM
jgi:hypothetical protein